MVVTRGILWAGLAVIVVLAGAQTHKAHANDRPVVFAAASLRSALDRIADLYGAASGSRPVLSYAGSSALARQIMLGAPADIFISASPDWMDRLADEEMLVPGSRVNLLGNRLVLIAHDPTIRDVALNDRPDLVALLQGGRLAMAYVEAVPVGVYGKAGLRSLGLWESVSSRIAQTDDARAALALVARGEAPLGVVYASDAWVEPDVHVAAVFPEASHPPIVYPAAVLSGYSTPEALRFLDWLRESTGAQAEFIANGFLLPAGMD